MRGNTWAIKVEKKQFETDSELKGLDGCSEMEGNEK